VVGLWNALVWKLTHAAVDAVRFQPRHLELLLACGTSEGSGSAPLARWLVETRKRPAYARATGAPRTLFNSMAGRAGRWFGPTTSTMIRLLSGATAALADRAGGRALEQAIPLKAHPGLLVPHKHELAVVAVDMRGFSQLTSAIDDTQYLTELISEYLTRLTEVIERHDGVVFQYTGDGLLAVFLPELTGAAAGPMFERVVHDVGTELHESFDILAAGWRADWQSAGRTISRIGLGVGISFGNATIGYLGPSGKKHIGVIGEPVNQAAYLCAQAPAGSLLIDRASFDALGLEPPEAKTSRLRSKKPHQRIETIRLDPLARSRQ
jgi:class 3 adenylate cyclase